MNKDKKRTIECRGLLSMLSTRENVYVSICMKNKENVNHFLVIIVVYESCQLFRKAIIWHIPFTSQWRRWWAGVTRDMTRRRRARRDTGRARHGARFPSRDVCTQNYTEKILKQYENYDRKSSEVSVCINDVYANYNEKPKTSFLRRCLCPIWLPR